MFVLLALLTCLCNVIYAATVPFNIDGALERYAQRDFANMSQKLTDGSASASSQEYNSGGTMVVNGMSITVPKNLQVQFPAAWVPWKTVAGGSFTGNEVSVVGNVVDGKAIAGMVNIGQFLLETNSGIISGLDFNGLITMDNGQKIRINDPNGVYSAGYKLRPEFTADDVSPSITAYSGFPMCVPRSANDPKCPSSNRPAGQTVFAASDPLTMAPFKVGDYIVYSGVMASGEVICYNIVAEGVQITTSGMPPYIRMEDAIVGVVDTQDRANVEFADTRFIGYTSDGAVSLQILRMEVDPCTGEVNEVSIGSATPVAGATRNKFTFRASGANPQKYTREYMIRASTGTKETNSGQITAGEYVQPVTEWVFPEELDGGRVPAKLDFSNMLSLRDGLGPDADGNIWGPLNPWPDTTAPTAKVCSTTPTTPTTSPSATSSAVPAADAGPDQQTRPGVFPTGDLSYNWTQIEGPAIALKNAGTASPSFQAPTITANTTYTFRLDVKSALNPTAISNDTVSIISSLKNVDSVVIDSFTWTSQKSGTGSVTAHSNAVDGSVKTMNLFLNNPNAGTAIAMISAGGGKFTADILKTKQPSNGITVVSSLGGRASLTTLTAKRKRSGGAVLDFS
ncbi:hypothetical protein K431DRAFT_298558 [Polychaeton citri CBS 116435]|uniref:Uncharacterized protein n=1 Tax=Polychaeton citri CBS 116435 TaxID=1314669 RepID=A0A9P4UI79_9PEZI|nr:hypothetical protein K431DRAFT_298558 [Polychaeton citri CBS 116435]